MSVKPILFSLGDVWWLARERVKVELYNPNYPSRPLTDQRGNIVEDIVLCWIGTVIEDQFMTCFDERQKKRFVLEEVLDLVPDDLLDDLQTTLWYSIGSSHMLPESFSVDFHGGSAIIILPT